MDISAWISWIYQEIVKINKRLDDIEKSCHITTDYTPMPSPELRRAKADLTARNCFNFEHGGALDER